MSIVLLLMIPPLFILDLWLAHLTGQWYADLVGDDTGTAASMIAFLAFCVYGVVFGFALLGAHERIGAKK